jgi:Ni2+-binding GTPase involved in maturation of urease and hydrogenase
MEQQKIRFVLIGGFLGAGKTTLIGELARRYVAAGKRVGIITNDQAADLVDTRHLRSQGFDVGEVAGACFCCSFDELVATAESLSGEHAPDVLLAEPVGSCTDLVATIVLPLQQMLGDRFELAPFGVLLKPSHGRRILSTGENQSRSGFSPQAEYIFRKQLEEADYLMIGRSDELADEEIAELTRSLKNVADDIPVVAVSPKTGLGVDQVLGYIESPMVAGRRMLEIDYDTYADGEAELGWVNLTANLDSETPVDLDEFAKEIVGRIAGEIRELHMGDFLGQIAHLKASVLAGDTQAIANVVSNDSQVDVGLASRRSVAGRIQVILNARVAMEPSTLEQTCRSQIDAVAMAGAMQVVDVNAHSLRPGRPTPTHRVTTT